MLGFIAAVGFATILAVVAGLTLAGAAALSHDVWVSVVRKGHADHKEQLRVARVAVVLLGALAIVLGIAFKDQNVAFMVGLAFAVAASGNFPALVLAIFWRRATTAGMVSSIIVGTVSALVFIYYSPTIQVDIFKHADAWFPLKNPALITIPLSFVVGVVVSLLTPEKTARDAYDAKERRMILGVAAEYRSAMSELLLNLLSPDVLRNPYPSYERLRAAEPVHRSPLGFVFLSRHEDMSAILKDKRFGKTFAERMVLREQSGDRRTAARVPAAWASG